MYELILSEQAQADYDWLAQTHGEAFIERVDRLLLQLKHTPGGVSASRSRWAGILGATGPFASTVSIG